MHAKDSLGRYGENVAVAHLQGIGMDVLERNWRCRAGEIDVIAVDSAVTGDCLVICEVKTRRSAVAGSPVEAVTPAKVSRLRRLTAAWLADQDRHFAEIRIDVVAVLHPLRGPVVIEHLKGVF
jgi:putative endonuclease